MIKKTEWLEAKNMNADDFTKKIRDGIWKTKDKSMFKDFDDYVNKAINFFPNTLLIKYYEYKDHFTTRMKRNERI